MEALVLPLLLSLAAGLSTGIGGLVPFFIRKFDNKHLAFLLGFSAGVMILVSFIELLPQSMQAVGFELSTASFFAGLLIMLAIDYLIPHAYKEESFTVVPSLKKTGTLVAIGIAIHNIPEGLVVLVSALSSLKLGIFLAFAIALHNIPEGIAVSVPITYATHDRVKAFMYSLAAGLVEPAGALIAGLILMPFITPALVNSLLGFAAGAMVFISLDELIPTAHEYVCRNKNYTGHAIIVGIISGMMVMMLSLWLLQ